MPRYTDIDKLIAEYDRVHVGPAGGARKLMVEAPIADVVPRAEVGEHLEDLLTEFDEFGMQPTILVPDPEAKAIEWKRKLEYAISNIKVEMAKEIFAEIEELFRQHKEGGYYLNEAWYPERLDLYTEDAFEELEKKYTEGEK